MRRLQEDARARRIATYGPDREPTFSPELEQFRDDMLRRIDNPHGQNVRQDSKLSLEVGNLHAQPDPAPATTPIEELEVTNSLPVRQFVSIDTEGVRVSAFEDLATPTVGVTGIAQARIEELPPALEVVSDDVEARQAMRNLQLNSWDSQRERNVIHDEDLLAEIEDEDAVVSLEPIKISIRSKDVLDCIKMDVAAGDEEPSPEMSGRSSLFIIEESSSKESSVPLKKETKSSVKISRKLIEEIETDQDDCPTLEVSDESFPMKKKSEILIEEIDV